MNNRIVVLFFCCAGLLCALDDVPLSPVKEEILKQKRTEIDTGAEALRYDWIAPLKLSLSHTEQKSPGESGFGGTSQAAASWNQDLFRSGGITYAIRYADARHAFDRLGWAEARDGYRLGLFTAVLNIRKAQLQCERSETLLKNQDIALFIKRQQYEAGATDITELNDAIVARNSEQKNLLALEQALADGRAELKKYTDLEAETVVLPEFSLLERDAYLAQNYAAESARLQSEVAYDTYRVTKASYLPALSLNTAARYTQQHDDGEDGASYSAGLTLSLPLAYNGADSVETERAAMLRQKAEAADTAREEGVAYQQARNLITRYEKENGVFRDNLKLYDTLIGVIGKGVEAGYKTGYDLQTLQNTKHTDELSMKINTINIQLELAKLHYSTYGEGQ
jgi:outer membrane protein TolC